MKGPVRTSGAERVAALQQIGVVLINDPVDISMKTKGSLGEVTFREEMYKPIIEYLATKLTAKISDIETALSSTDIKLGQVVEVLTLLINEGMLRSLKVKRPVNRASYVLGDSTGQFVKNRNSQTITERWRQL